MERLTTHPINADQQAPAEGISDIGKLIKFISIILLSPLIYAFTREAALSVITNFDFNLLRYFFYGIGASVLMYILLPYPLRCLAVFDHELAHAIVAKALGRQILKFRVTCEEGGEVGHSKPRSFLITLAPYCLPILALPFLFSKPFIPTQKDVINFLIGFSLALHYVALADWEFRSEQPDLREMGYFFSLGIALLVNAILLVVILSTVLDNYTIALEYLRIAWTTTQKTYQVALDLLQSTDITYAFSQLR